MVTLRLEFMWISHYSSPQARVVLERLLLNPEGTFTGPAGDSYEVPMTTEQAHGYQGLLVSFGAPKKAIRIIPATEESHATN